MKKKKLLTLFAALTAGSFLLLSGCGVDLTAINAEDTDISAELETENLSDGTILVHSVWYSADGSKLTAATVTLSSSGGELFSGTTDDSGSLEECTLPGNTTITCEITDSAGDVIAEAEIIFKLSSDYTDLTIYTSDNETEDSQCILEIPTEKTDIRAAVFVTEEGGFSFVNLTPYSESDDETDSETTDSEDSASADDAAETGEATDNSDSADTQDTSGEDTAGGGEDTTAAGETATENDTSGEGDTAEGETAAE